MLIVIDSERLNACCKLAPRRRCLSSIQIGTSSPTLGCRHVGWQLAILTRSVLSFRKVKASTPQATPVHQQLSSQAPRIKQQASTETSRLAQPLNWSALRPKHSSSSKRLMTLRVCCLNRKQQQTWKSASRPSTSLCKATASHEKYLTTCLAKLGSM